MPLSAQQGRGASFDLSALYRIAATAVGAGLVAGVLLTGVQQLQVNKLILQAEVYEDAADKAAEAAPVPAPVTSPAAQSASDAPAAADDDAGAHDAHHAHGHDHEHAGHEHHHDDWKPENGVERTAYSVVANITIGVAFGLLLAAAFSLRGERKVGWRAGLLWGAAGYLVFFAAPSLGLPPEVPGTAAAPLAARQGWWIATAASTAAALYLLAFVRSRLWKALAIALLVAPHLVGAPQPEVEASAAPVELAHAFIYATALSNAFFWLLLGALAGAIFDKTGRAR
jgi:cobalt transporter subunit CbtA